MDLKFCFAEEQPDLQNTGITKSLLLKFMLSWSFFFSVNLVKPLSSSRGNIASCSWTGHIFQQVKSTWHVRWLQPPDSDQHSSAHCWWAAGDLHLSLQSLELQAEAHGPQRWCGSAGRSHLQLVDGVLNNPHPWKKHRQRTLMVHSEHRQINFLLYKKCIKMTLIIGCFEITNE